MIKTLIIIMLLIGPCLAADLPDSKLTPGDALTTDTIIICQTGYTKTVRNVTYGMVQEVYLNYELEYENGRRETDHLIPLELGGSNAVSNLWPQERYGTLWTAYKKDRLENKLHWLVCRHRLAIKDAQYKIAHNWIDAYKEYIGK